MFYVHNYEGIKHDATREVLEQRLKVYQLHDKPKVRKYVEKEGGTFYNKSHGSLTQGDAERAYQSAMQLEQEVEDICHAYQIMNKPVKTVSPDAFISKAWEMFKSLNIRHMPVLSPNNKIVGIISDRDLLKYVSVNERNLQIESHKKIRDIMATDVITANPMTDIRKIAQMLFEHRISAMPIVDEKDNLVGIITRSDILHAVIHHNVLNVQA
ncbi:MAG: CBS domain-containing protein [Leptospiraceae bacterium]|nr:CBS domain-containing protein [Leptospiraceae bacterium]MCP5493407.1 CBS domain-containing protein [Leptospiraceae bacterium]